MTSTHDRPILVIVCGGTIVMEASNHGGLQIQGKDDVRGKMRELLSDASAYSRLNVEFLMAIDSTDMNCEDWSRVANLIIAEEHAHKAVIVVTGTNTLAYLSSALSFALSSATIPVVVTGSQLPSTLPYSDARMNFLNSVRVATMPISGVFVVFGQRVILGCRAKKVSESQLSAFATFNSADIGAIGIDIAMRTIPRRQSLDRELRESTVFENRIACITLLPGMTPEYVSLLIDSGCRGLILRSFGSGDIPQTLFPALEYAKAMQIPIVNTTQCPGGATKMGINEVGRIALEYNVIQAFDMSMEAMSTKLMWLLGQGISIENIRRIMQINLVGELGEGKFAA